MRNEGFKSPILMLTALDSDEDKIKGLDAGADDYVTKPFETKELVARIKVALRNVSVPVNTVLSFDKINLDTMTHDVSVNQQEVKLTRTEYAILKMLMQNPSQVIAKSIMLERISQDTPDCTENSLKIHVSNLRKKLREISGKDYIEAVWGIGFKFTAE